MLEKLQWLLIGLLVIACIVLAVMLSNLQTRVDRIEKWIGGDTGAAAWMRSEPPKMRARFDDLCKRIDRAHPNTFPECTGPGEEPPKDGPVY